MNNHTTKTLIALLFFIVVLVSLKRSNDYLKFHGAILSSRHELVGPQFVRRQGRRSFVLPQEEFHYVDVDLIRRQMQQRDANSTSSENMSDLPTITGPIHATMLVEGKRTKKQNPNEDPMKTIEENTISEALSSNTALSNKQAVQLPTDNTTEHDERSDASLVQNNQEELVFDAEDAKDESPMDNAVGVHVSKNWTMDNTIVNDVDEREDAMMNEGKREIDLPPTEQETNEQRPDQPSEIAELEIDEVINWDATALQAVDRGEITDAQVNIAGTAGRVSDNRLIADVDESFVFWNGGQARLCDLLRAMTLRSSLEEKIVPTLMARPLLNVTMDCVAMNKNENFGQGNWITALYSVHLAAVRAQVDHQMQCRDGRQSQMQLLLPWFDGYHAAPNETDPWPYFGDMPSQVEACTGQYPNIRVDKMADKIVDDIQRMAVSLVGSRDAIRWHPSIPEDQEPLIPHVDLDDVAIHFRCGDVMGGAKRNDFGMIKFSEYKKWISPNARTVGILTQPFEKERNRAKDAGRVDACRKATYALADNIQSYLPNATISIHNGINETLPLAFARLAMANQSFTSLSSFGIFPVIGTFGQGYFQQGNRGVNPFTQYLPAYLPNLHEMYAPKLGTWDMYKMQVDDILTWLDSPEEVE
jgi:hypothetical protein